MKNHIIKFEKGVPFSFNVKSIKKYPLHYHENVVEILMPIKGSLRIKSSFENHIITEGDFLFINNEVIHAIESDGSIAISFHIDLNYFEKEFPYIKYMFFRSFHFSNDSLDNYTESTLTKDLKLEFKTNFRNFLLIFLVEYLDGNLSVETLTKSFIDKIVYLMIYEFDWLKFQRKTDDFLNFSHLERYYRIVKYIKENYNSKISLDDVVKSEFISKTYFSHFWKNISFYSFRDRVSYERVIKSEAFLFENLTITEISNRCGFSDVKYYYKNFKHWYKIMPLEFKEKWINYSNLEDEYSILDFSDVELEFEDYLEKFFAIEYTPSSKTNINYIIEEYLYIKYCKKSNNLSGPSNIKHITIVPFKSLFYTLTKTDFTYNWHFMDLLINLALEFDLQIQIKFEITKNSDKIISSHISKFIELSIERYGANMIKFWDFKIVYYDIFMSPDIEQLDTAVKKNFNNLSIKYYYEP